MMISSIYRIVSFKAARKGSVAWLNTLTSAGPFSRSSRAAVHQALETKWSNGWLLYIIPLLLAGLLNTNMQEWAIFVWGKHTELWIWSLAFDPDSAANCYVLKWPLTPAHLPQTPVLEMTSVLHPKMHLSISTTRCSGRDQLHLGLLGSNWDIKIAQSAALFYDFKLSAALTVCFWGIFRWHLLEE